MEIIKTPPPRVLLPFTDVIKNHFDELTQYLQMSRPTDEQGRYQHFDEFRFRVPKKLDAALCWNLTKEARSHQLNELLRLGEPNQLCQYFLTTTIQKAQSFCDRFASDGALELMSQKIGEQEQFNYLINDLIEDEAISSSQLEGAATTTKKAKELLGQGRTPRTPDERMILGNFHMMRFVWENRAKPLSPDFIMAIHKEGVDGIDNDKYHPGYFRQDDDVVVEGRDGEVVHQPPPAANLPRRMQLICDWINGCHDEINCSTYIHPMVKAMVLHFSIGFEHPFRDGNGRVARALFYWFMFKSGFAAFRYIAISTLLKKAPVQYGKSYLYTETDEMDMTYFIDYQSQILLRAIKQFEDVCKKIIQQREEFDALLWKLDIARKLNTHQIIIFHVAKNRGIGFTARSVEHNLNIAYGTAASALKGLEKLGLFYSIKEGRSTIYFLNDQKDVIARWKE